MRAAPMCFLYIYIIRCSRLLPPEGVAEGIALAVGTADGAGVAVERQRALLIEAAGVVIDRQGAAVLPPLHVIVQVARLGLDHHRQRSVSHHVGRTPDGYSLGLHTLCRHCVTLRHRPRSHQTAATLLSPVPPSSLFEQLLHIIVTVTRHIIVSVPKNPILFIIVNVLVVTISYPS